jgi:hypothetical protein
MQSLRGLTMRVVLFPFLALATTAVDANDDIACRTFEDKCLPVVDTGDVATAYVIGGSPVAANPDIKIFYSDGPSLTAHLQFGPDALKGEDVLEFQGTADITSDWQPDTGSLYVYGTAVSADELESALRQVTYRNIATSPHTGVRTVHWSVSTDTGFSGYTPSTIDVVAP